MRPAQARAAERLGHGAARAQQHAGLQQQRHALDQQARAGFDQRAAGQLRGDEVQLAVVVAILPARGVQLVQQRLAAVGLPAQGA